MPQHATRNIALPVSEDEVRRLRIGDQVLLNGVIYTARDCAHKMLAEREEGIMFPSLPDLHGAVLYHCGPVVVRDVDGSWRVTAAGPTTSIREEPYMAEIIRRYGIRAIIGKGGLGAKTLAACREVGCVYLHAVGGAAQVLANSITRVSNVFCLEEFGVPEAIWELHVSNFPATVTMDSIGGNLHSDVRQVSEERLRELCPMPPER